MQNIIKKMVDDKKEYRAQMARIEALPKDYQFVYHKIQNYMWGFAGGYGLDMQKTQYDLIDLFEQGSSQGKHVLEVTGKDVASFCEELIQGNKQWRDDIRNRLNRKINNKLEDEKDSR